MFLWGWRADGYTNGSPLMTSLWPHVYIRMASACMESWEEWKECIAHCSDSTTWSSTCLLTLVMSICLSLIIIPICKMSLLIRSVCGFVPFFTFLTSTSNERLMFQTLLSPQCGLVCMVIIEKMFVCPSFVCAFVLCWEQPGINLAL